MKSILSLALLMFAMNASAGEVVFHGLTVHGNSSWFKTNRIDYVNEKNEVVRSEKIRVYTKYNNVNLGVGYRFDNGISTGVFYNSFEKASLYVSKDFMYNDNFGVFIGGATGYKSFKNKDIVAIGGLLFRYEVQQNVFLNLTYSPAIEGSASVTHTSLSYRFK